MVRHKSVNRLCAALLAAIMMLGIMPAAAFTENSWGGTGVAEVQKDPDSDTALCAMGNNLVLKAGSNDGLTNIYYADATGSTVNDPIDLGTMGLAISGAPTGGFDLSNVRLWGTYTGRYNNDANAFAGLDVLIRMEGGTLSEIMTGNGSTAVSKSLTVYMSGGTLTGENISFYSAITAPVTYVSGGRIEKNLTAQFPRYLSGAPSIGGEGCGITVKSGEKFYLNGALSGASVYVVPQAAFADGTVIAEGSGYQITENDIAQLHLTGDYAAGKELYLDGNSVKIRTKQVTAYNVWVGNTQVTEENASDVLGDNTVSYDATTNTLTLSGLNLSDQGHEAAIQSDTVFASVFAQGDLNIVLADGSTNTISTTGAIGNTQVLGAAAMAEDGSAGKISVSGSGSLSVTQTLSSNTTYSVGIFGGEVAVTDADLNFSVSGSGYTMGIGADKLDIQNADITCSGMAYGLIGTSSLSVSGDSHIKATGSMGALYCAGGTISVGAGLTVLGGTTENDFENLSAAQVSSDGKNIVVGTETAKTVEITGIPAIFYLDETGNELTLTGPYTVVTSDVSVWTNGWYVVDGNVSIDGGATVSGDVKLILKDGASLAVNGGINVPSGSTFTVYGQKNGTGTLTTVGGNGNAGIGGAGNDVNFGTIILAAKGQITATGDTRAAGIGGGGQVRNNQQVNGTIYIYCGTIEATGGRWAAGIGGGADSITDCTVTIDGGNVTARGGENNVGIGGTEGAKTIIINGGSIMANGSGSGAGIGGSYDASGGTITITGGVVEASGIGGGSAAGGGSGGTIEISGGIVTADRIGAGGSNTQGSFSTGESGDAVIFANSITDQSAKNDWCGLIFENGVGKIYDISYTVDENLTIPAGNTLVVENGKTLIVNKGVVITNNGTIKVEKDGSYSGDQPDKKVTYQIDWDTDGDGTVDDTTYAAYDDKPTHADGRKDSTPATVYTFTGWSPAVAEVTGTASYTAQFSSSVRTYTVTIPSGDGYAIRYSGGTELAYNSDFTFTVEIAQGYYQAAGFGVKANGDALAASADGSYTVKVDKATEITVEGVAKEAALAAPAVDTGEYDSGWTAEDVTLTPSATADSGVDHYEYSTNHGEHWTVLAGNSLTISDLDLEADYIFRAVSKAGNTSPASTPVTVKIDRTAPDGDIKFGENSVKKAINQITFGIVFNKSIDVEITASDSWGEVNTVEYYKSDKVLTESEVQSIAGWFATDGKFSVTAEDQVEFIYYVKITDKAGNVTCFGSDGATFDLTPPSISGIVNDGTYYTTQEVTVADDHLASVALNGASDDESLTLAGNTDERYTIVAIDKAGNETAVTVTMKPIGSLDDAIAGITADTVTSADKAAIEQVKSAVEAVGTATAADEEKAALQEVLDRCESLLAKLEESAQAGSTDNTEKVENVTADNVKPENKDDLTAAKEDLENALENFGDNYTEEKKAALEEKLERVDKALESLEKTETVNDAISKLPDTAEPDETDKETLIKEARKQYEALTEHEQSLIPEELKEKLENLLADLVNYRIIAGDNGRWMQASDGSLGFTANGAYSKFTGIQVDGKDVDASRYTAKSGSTIITLKAEYLNTLSAGKHTLTVLYTDGQTSGSFEIVKAAGTDVSEPDAGGSAPAGQSDASSAMGMSQTGGNSQIALWFVLLIAASFSAAGMLLYVRIRKRDQ